MGDSLIDIQSYFELQHSHITIDVRSPLEFVKAHIPNSYNIPLFSDEERAEVGTIYKHEGKEAALKKGLHLVGPKLNQFIEDVKNIIQDKSVTIYCWRGGQRSYAMSWLMQMAGIPTCRIQGGYKSYRSYIQHYLNNTAFNFVLLSGKTGSAKTKILHRLKELGEQIIDLECIAQHKGSAFGWIGEQKQPSSEHFENILFQNLMQLKANSRIWIENESRNIGHVFLPEGLWQQMRTAPLIQIEREETFRIQQIVDDYTGTQMEDLEASFLKLTKRLGSDNCKKAIDYVKDRNYQEATKIALQYYDKLYAYGLSQVDESRVTYLNTIDKTDLEIAHILKEM